MAKISLSEGFSLIPKGSHVFQIVDVNYKEDFGKMEVTLQMASGQKHTERFSLLNKDGEPNVGGMNAFSYFAKAAMNDFTLSEIDHEDLVGHFIRCEVDHEQVESNRTPGKMVTFIRLGNKEPAEGFDTPAKKPVQKAGKGFDLNSLLG